MDAVKPGNAALLITANYKGAADTKELLQSLRRLKSFSRLDVVIVDNASGDGSAEDLRAEARGLENVCVLESSINRGYFGAAKWALNRYLEEGSGLPDWVIVSNNDIYFEDHEFLEKLFSRDPENSGVIAPRIWSSQSLADQNPHLEKRLSRSRLAMIRFWSSNYQIASAYHQAHIVRNLLRARIARLKGRTPQNFASDGSSRRIYAPYGAFIIFSRKYFQAGGYIDDGFFLYGEEITVAEVCLALGLDVIYDPDLAVWHKENRTIGKGLTRFAYQCQKESRRYFMRKYYSGAR